MSRPTLAAVILGRKLLGLRLAANLTQRQVCKQSRFSDSKLSDIENGKVKISLFDVAGLCRVYKVDPELADHLERMSEEADGPGWWEPFRTHMIRDFSMLLELEDVCSALDIYESELIPGLLQTRRYALAVNAVVKSLTEDEVNTAAELRLLRQERFWSRSPMPRVRIIISAAALRLGAVDQEQRQRLIDADAMDNVDVRVISDETPHPSMRGGYLILTSGVDEIDDCMYTENMAGARYDTTAAILSASREVFDQTFALAIPVKEHLNGSR